MQGFADHLAELSISTGGCPFMRALVTTYERAFVAGLCDPRACWITERCSPTPLLDVEYNNPIVF